MIFTVVVPTFNRCESLKKTVESIRRQGFSDFELIVVNDGSSDGTDDYLSGFISESTITYIKQPNFGPARARNAGIHEAKGTYVAFTDDDCVVPPDWLKRLHNTLSAGGIDIVGGAVRNTVKNIFADTGQTMTNHFVRSLSAKDPSTPFLTSNNVAYRLAALQRAGGFDERFSRAGGEERALHLKIRDAGGRSAFLGDCTVDHAHPFTFSNFVRQQFNYGRGAFLLYRVVGRELTRTPEAIPFGVYLSLFAQMFRSGVVRGIAMSALYVFAELAVIAGYLVQASAPREIRNTK
jgi:glycosyltransferase involved in cell wall biosynthesis